MYYTKVHVCIKPLLDARHWRSATRHWRSATHAPVLSSRSSRSLARIFFLSSKFSVWLSCKQTQHQATVTRQYVRHTRRLTRLNTPKQNVTAIWSFHHERLLPHSPRGPVIFHTQFTVPFVQLGAGKNMGANHLRVHVPTSTCAELYVAHERVGVQQLAFDATNTTYIIMYI